jgi:hypothetical protein
MPRVAGCIKAYNDGEYDFGIDQNVVTHITGLTSGEASKLVECHSKNENGM